MRAAEMGVGDAISWLGWRRGDDLKELFVEADLLVIPSLMEGSPNVVLEAFCSRLPVIATQVGGIPELVGDAAATCESGDGVALAALIDSVLAQPSLRARLAAEGLSRAIARHSPAVIAKQLMELRMQVCDK